MYVNLVSESIIKHTSDYVFNIACNCTVTVGKATHTYALPTLPANLEWYLYVSTILNIN